MSGPRAQTQAKLVAAGGWRVRRTRAEAGVLLAVALAAALVAACGSAPPTGSPGASPAATASGEAAGPRTTPWPGNAVLGMEALGVSDGQIGAAMYDLSKGVAEEDLALMRRAAAGLSGLDEAVLPNMAKIRLEPGMVSFADRYEAAIKKVDDAATQLRDAIDAGDAAAISTATEAVVAGMADYTALKPELSAWLVQIPEHKKMNTR
jgi:hypothetical protein